MTNLFAHFQTKAAFLEALSSIPANAIVFIKDTKQIYTHGQYYDSEDPNVEEIISTALNDLNNRCTDNDSKIALVKAKVAALRLEFDEYEPLPSNLIIEDDDVYIRKTDGNVYPVNHPDLSTQPSILPQRFGNLYIYEVLIANTGTSDIIETSEIEGTIIEAFVFNGTSCVPANTQYADGKLYIMNAYEIVPEFALVKYTRAASSGYYGYN